MGSVEGQSVLFKDLLRGVDLAFTLKNEGLWVSRSKFLVRSQHCETSRDVELVFFSNPRVTAPTIHQLFVVT